MADVYTRIGYIKGATGAQGERGLQGDPGDAATIQVGTVTTVPYGQTANVVNSGTSGAAVFDFTIPQGKPGEQTTDMQNLTLGSITTSSASFPVPAVGETGKVLWGKVVKWFSDMAALVASKFDASNVVNNLTTTDSGFALDARQGKTLQDQITSLNDSLQYESGDTLTLTVSETVLLFSGRLGFSRQRVFVTIPLDRPIAHIQSVSISGEIVIYAPEEARKCTVTSVTHAYRNNFLCLMLSITPDSAWPSTADCLALFELRAGSTLTINF